MVFGSKYSMPQRCRPPNDNGEVVAQYNLDAHSERHNDVSSQSDTVAVAETQEGRDGRFVVIW